MDHHPATSLPIDRAAMTWTPNQARDHGWTCPPVSAEVRDFHRTLPGYAPTTLADLPGLARDLGVAHVLAKDESNRLGLPAFKGLGASWAIHRALRDRSDSGGSDRPVTIVTATDGNHGRAVARFARQLGRRICEPSTRASLQALTVSNLGRCGVIPTKRRTGVLGQGVGGRVPRSDARRSAAISSTS